MAKKSDYTFEQETKTQVNDALHRGKAKIADSVEDVKKKADHAYQQVKNSASEVYAEGKKKVHDAQDYIEEHTDAFVKTVKEKPLTSLLVAGGIGFLLAALLKK